MQNVFACLVHESEECVVDLVHNLRTLDPTSAVLLYDGSPTATLLDGFPFERFGAVVVPESRPMSWGRLHDFAFDCIRFAVAHLSFDTITIVDSDQLAIRGGYSRFLSSFAWGQHTLGMFVSDTSVQTPASSAGPVRSVYAEFDSWRSLLRSFGAADDSIRWTFWPSTVFAADFASELIGLAQWRPLTELLERTEVWATEEVLFPTLATALGYELALNPGNGAYVQYGLDFTDDDLACAFALPDAFWVHPVPRVYSHPLRMAIRRLTHSGFIRSEPGTARPLPHAAHATRVRSAVSAMSAVPGWLDEGEASTLLERAAETLHDSSLPSTWVEIGSYLGRSTVALGTLLREIRPGGQLFAIDPHRGVTGSADTTLSQGNDTLAAFRRNVEAAALDTIVVPVVAKSADVTWTRPISLLFIDGLHDYPNVARDCLAYEPALVNGGLIALHDYSASYPDVVTLVEEIEHSGRFTLLAHTGTMVVFQKQRQAVSLASSAPTAEHGLAPSVWRSTALTSCIMPTSDRPEWVEAALELYSRQDLRRRELIVVDGGHTDVRRLCSGRPGITYRRALPTLSLGELRNVGCELAEGEIVVHWDDDDWSAPWRLSYQLDELLSVPDARICGLSSVIFSNREHSAAWQYIYPFAERAWLAGGTLCYFKSFWEAHPFPALTEGEDTCFVWSAKPSVLVPCEVNTFYVAYVHDGNTSRKDTAGQRWAPYPIEKVRQLVGEGTMGALRGQGR